MNKYLYISGAITGVENYYNKFKNCEEWLKKYTIYIPINPAIENKINLKKQLISFTTKYDYMRLSYNLLTRHKDTSIIMLPGFQGSKGAIDELYLAKKLNYCILFFVESKDHPSGCDALGISKGDYK